MYIFVNGDTFVYPYSFYDLQKDNPQVSFPEKMSPTLLKEWGLYEVFEVDIPLFDPENEIASKSEFVFNSKAQRWETKWDVRQMTQEEKDNTQRSHLIT